MTAPSQARVLSQVADDIGDEDKFALRRPVPQSVIDESRRQWDAIPQTAAEISVWMKRPPINPVKP